MIHEDERRTLEDWPEAKIITAKKDCELGNHFHKIKTEKFILTKGTALLNLGGMLVEMQIGGMVTVNPGVIHSFRISEGSILIGLCSHIFDPSDDYKP